MVCWTLQAIQESSLINYAVLSSDDTGILALAGGKTNRMRRPVELAEDWTPTESVIAHVLDGLEPVPDIIVLLQPTSPVRTGKQVDEAIQMMIPTKATGWYAPDSILSVVPSHAFLWYRTEHGRSATYDWTQRPRRQEMPPQFEENGSIYVFTKRLWDRTHNRLGGDVGLYVMDEWSRIQVDTPLDLAICDFLLRTQGYAHTPEGYRV